MGLQEKHRVGAQSDGQAFTSAVIAAFAPQSEIAIEDGTDAEKTMKRPAASVPLAIADGCDASVESVSKSNRNVKKKPASGAASTKLEVNKKPAAADGAPTECQQLNETNLAARDAEVEAQNMQLNKCLDVAVTMMQKQEMIAKRWIMDLQTCEVPDSKKRLKDIHVEELNRAITDIVVHIDQVKTATLTKSHVKYSDEKVDLLERSHSSIEEIKGIIKMIGNILGKKPDPSAASRAE